VIGGGISDYNTQKAGDDSGQNLCFVLRGMGCGSQLLALAEEKACEQGAKNAYLDTFSFQAPAFYEKHGYEVFGELPDFPPGHQRFFLKKEL
jgi:predicted N-acetyltransferase YhbS